jgi:hypothetical protein
VAAAGTGADISATVAITPAQRRTVPGYAAATTPRLVTDLRADWYDFQTRAPLGSSAGSAKVKAGPTGSQWRIVLRITAGDFAPPLGQKTKIEGTVDLIPDPLHSYDCSADDDPMSGVIVQATDPSTFIVSQK